MSAESAWVDAGLLDPAGPDADERRRLLAYLQELGIPIEELQEAARGRGLGTAATDQLLRPRGLRSLADAATAAGIDVDLARRVFLAAGLAGLSGPDGPDAGFDDADVMVLAAFAEAMAAYGDEAVLALVRVVGSSLARIAETADAMFLTQVEGPLRAGGGDSTDVARSARHGTELLLGLPTVMAPLFRHHVVAAVHRSRAARDVGRVDWFLMAVGFADLVGSTALTDAVEPAVLGRALADFEREAADRATAAGARLVKAIGDEVMVASADPVAVVDVLVGLAGFVRDHPVLTEVRAAAAMGKLVGRDGDWFGPEVNLAARAVRGAPPGRVVVTGPVADALRAAGRPVGPSLGERALRGIAGPVALHLVGEPPEAGR